MFKFMGYLLYVMKTSCEGRALDREFQKQPLMYLNAYILRDFIFGFFMHKRKTCVLDCMHSFLVDCVNNDHDYITTS